MRIAKTEGIIIKRISLAEADRIVTVFSDKFGKITLIAKGVRKITSRRSSHIELLNHSKLSIYKGKSMFNLVEVESVENYAVLKQDLKKVGYAYHVCELVDSLCAENQENLAIFNLLKEVLATIEKSENPTFAIKNFEIKLLSLLGFSGVSQNLNFNTQQFIEDILERKLKAKEIASTF